MSRYAWLILLAALGIAGSYLTVTTSQTESGWATLVTQWQDLILEDIGLGHTAISYHEPPEQASFWLAEIEILEPQLSGSASLQMGAAWVLDSAGISFLTENTDKAKQGDSLTATGLDAIESEAIAANEIFRQRCLERCLTLAKRATEIEPDDLRWWRMRALLLFDGEYYGSGRRFEPRHEDWLDILELCSQRDPDNALYDYLAALQLWQIAASYEWSEDQDRWVLAISDADLFAEGTERFLAGQAKPFLTIGEAGAPAIADFLAKTQLRVTDQAHVATQRMLTGRHSLHLHGLWRWLNVRTDQAMSQNDLHLVKNLLLQRIHLYDQAIVPEETSALEALTKFSILRQIDFDELVKIVQEHPDLVRQDEYDVLRKREARHRIETETLQQALQQIQLEREQPFAVIYLDWAVTEIACQSAVYLLLLALCCSGLAMIGNGRQLTPISLGYLRHFLAWFIGCSLSFLVFGAFPAEIISLELQTLFANAVALGLAFSCLLIFSVAIVRYWRHKKFRFRLTNMFAATAVIAFLAYLWPIMNLALSTIAFRPNEWLPQADGLGGYGMGSIKKTIVSESSLWHWAFFQWHEHKGHVIAGVLSLTITATWAMYLCAKESNDHFLRYWTNELKLRWPPLGRLLGATAAAAGGCSLLVYFCFAPTIVRMEEASFLYKIEYYRYPLVHYAKIRQAQENIKSSAETKQLIREQIEFELSDAEVLEKDYSAKESSQPPTADTPGRTAGRER